MLAILLGILTWFGTDRAVKGMKSPLTAQARARLHPMLSAALGLVTELPALVVLLAVRPLSRLQQVSAALMAAEVAQTPHLLVHCYQRLTAQEAVPRLTCLGQLYRDPAPARLRTHPSAPTQVRYHCCAVLCRLKSSRASLVLLVLRNTSNTFACWNEILGW